MSSDLDALREWVAAKARDFPPAGLTDDLPLLEGRHLTSLHVPELILLLERLRGRAIDVEHLRPGDFRDITTIAARFLPATAFAAELAPLGLRWHGNGQVSLSGPLGRLAAQCDSAFTTLAGLWAAEPEEHPAMLDLAAMQATGYLSSFPHLATFPVCLAAEKENLRDFAAAPLAADGAVHFTRTAPVREILTPAACYHVFVGHARKN